MADDPTYQQLFELLDQATYRNREYHKTLQEIKKLAEQVLADDNVGAMDLGDSLVEIREKAGLVLYETEPLFHCYSCHQDKHRSERSPFTSAVCQVCYEASVPSLHPELYDREHPESMAAYQHEQALRKATCPRCSPEQ